MPAGHRAYGEGVWIGCLGRFIFLFIFILLIYIYKGHKLNLAIKPQFISFFPEILAKMHALHSRLNHSTQVCFILYTIYIIFLIYYFILAT